MPNDFYDFIESNYDIFVKEDCVTLKQAWAMYNDYCEFKGIPCRIPMRAVRGELRNYFERYDERITIDGNRVRNYYSGFKASRFDIPITTISSGLPLK